MHMAAAVDSYTAIVGTGWANSCFGCTDGLRKHYSPLVVAFVLTQKVVWVLKVCLLGKNADCCKFNNN